MGAGTWVRYRGPPPLLRLQAPSSVGASFLGPELVTCSRPCLAHPGGPLGPLKLATTTKSCLPSPPVSGRELTLEVFIGSF